MVPHLHTSTSARQHWGLLFALLLATTPSAASEAKRAPQDYGRPEERSADKALLWGPRVVFFPLWLTTEYGLRRPLGAVVQVAEREQWPKEIVDLFTFGDRRQITIFPSALFDFGLLPSVGFNAQWRYFVTDPNTVRLHFGTWGPDWVAIRFVDSYALSKNESIALDGRLVRRQDSYFFGFGPRSSADASSRYRSEHDEASFAYEARMWRSSAFQARSGVRRVSLGDETCCDAPSVYDSVSRGLYPRPPGLGESWVAGFEHVSITLDSRKPRPEEGTGVRLTFHCEGVAAPGETTRRAWVKYGAEVGAFVDLTGTQRVISVGAAVELADPLSGTIPFPEQATLGGARPMRGYVPNRLVDRSSFVAHLHYTWPIWVYLDGVIQVDVGNVFGARLDGFDARPFRLSSSIGVRSNGNRDSGFELLVGGATDPLDQGLHVSSLRFVVGAHHGF